MSSESNPLQHLYDKLLSAFHSRLGDSESHLPGLQSMMQEAAEKVVEAEEFTEQEVQRVSEYLVYDIRDAIEHLYASTDELKAWAAFDLEQIESHFGELLLSVADPTRVELSELFRRRKNLED